jgi:epsilon-lactone hydrolase
MKPRRAGRASPGRSGGIRVPAAVVRLGVRQLGRRALDPSLPWEVQRRRLDLFTRPLLVPKGTTVTSSMLNGIPTEVVAVRGVRADRTVVHFHGGGYCVGSARTVLTWAAHLSARTGCRVMLPEYRLAPEHPHPAALDDARGVMKALFGEADPASVVLSGDSAGGGLALALLHGLRDEAIKFPAGCILLSPWLDLRRDWRASPDLVRRDVMLSPAWLEACAAAYAGPAGLAQLSVSPLLAWHDSLPPILIQAGSDELLAPDSEHLAASASAAGVDVTYTTWPRMWHDFALEPGLLAAADSALSQAAWFVAAVTGC